MRHWLKEYRNKKGLTQEAVANKSSISRSFYTQVEIGTKTPSVPVAKRIAHTLDFDWTLFFDNQCSCREHLDISNRKEVV